MENKIRYKIYIDQGHNPVNPNAGAEGNGLREQDIVFRVGILLRDLLEENGHFEVKLSRPTAETQLGTSQNTSLAARANGANEWGADYFLSLHCNASASPEATGSEAYVYSVSSPAYRLAEEILRRMNLSTGLKNRGVMARPSLYVLRKTAMPAALIELGFITNPSDAAKLDGDPGAFARGICNGILVWLGLS